MNADGPVALGYLFLALVCAGFALGKPVPRVPDADERELERLHGGATEVEGNEFTEASEGGVPARSCRLHPESTRDKTDRGDCTRPRVGPVAKG